MLSKQISTSTRSSSCEEELVAFDYKLMMESPHLDNYSLVHKLYRKNYLNDTQLLTQQHADAPSLIRLEAQSPNIYIQKIRGLYYMFLFLGYQRKQQNFKCAFSSIRKIFYQNSRVEEIHKKYMAQFMNIILNYPESHIIKNTLNKYPIMDEILIDLLLAQVEPLTADDNYNICRWLTQLDMLNEVVTFYQLKIQQYLLKISETQIIIELDERTEILHSKLDESNVFSVREDIFEKMDRSFIIDLDMETQTQQEIIPHKKISILPETKQSFPVESHQRKDCSFETVEKDIVNILESIREKIRYMKERTQNRKSIKKKPIHMIPKKPNLVPSPKYHVRPPVHPKTKNLINFNYKSYTKI